MNERVHFGRKKTVNFNIRYLTAKNYLGPSWAALRTKALDTIAPDPLSHGHNCKNAKIINYCLFLKMHEVFLEASPTRIFVTSYEN